MDSLRPAAAKRQLRQTLRDRRERLRMTRDDVAKALKWSLSKLLRIENGKTPISVADLRALLSHYLVTDQREVDRLLHLAALSRQPTVASQYADVLPTPLAEWIDLETAAVSLRQFETKLVPGVLQTHRYAGPVIKAYRAADSSPREIARLTEARIMRAKGVTGPDGPEMYFIIDEAALRRGVGNEGGPYDFEVMIEQLEHLKRLNTVGRKGSGESIEVGLNPRISIQIVPFEIGAYELIRGPFELLELEDDTLVYLEDPLRDVVLSEIVQDTTPYVESFSNLQKDLAPAIETNGLIDYIIDLMRERQNGISVRGGS